MYAHSEEELRCEKKTVDELLHRGSIWPLKSLITSSIIFTKYCHNKKLRIYIDYRTLNNNTVKDCYPFPFINKTLRITAGASYLTCIYLRTAYWLIRMAKGEE